MKFDPSGGVVDSSHNVTTLKVLDGKVVIYLVLMLV